MPPVGCGARHPRPGVCRTSPVQAIGVPVLVGYGLTETSPVLTVRLLPCAAGWAKDTIVLTTGENVEPQPLEDLLATSPAIAFAVLLGSGHRSLGALVVPSDEALGAAGGYAASPELRRLLEVGCRRVAGPVNKMLLLLSCTAWRPTCAPLPGCPLPSARRRTRWRARWRIAPRTSASAPLRCWQSPSLWRATP